MCCSTLPRHQRAQRNPEQHQHRWARIGGTASGPSSDRGDAHRDHGTGDQPAREVLPKEKQHAAGGAA